MKQITIKCRKNGVQLLTLLTLAIWCMSPGLSMANVEYDASTTKKAKEVTSSTVSHTCSGVDRLLVVGICSKEGSVSSVTYDGSNLSLLAAATRGEVRTEMWYLLAPSTGANDVVVTMDDDRTFSIGVNSYTGVNQSSTFSSNGSAVGSSSPSSITLSSSPGELVIDALGVKATDPSPNGGQTQRTEIENEESLWHSSSDEIGASSVTISYTHNDEDWAIVGGSIRAASVLPIELSRFDVAQIRNTVRITWATATEINNDYFVVERSKGGVDFEEISSIPGAGNSYLELNYTFYDDNPFNSTSYYRLKQVDYDGHYTYSQVQVVNMTKEELTIVNLYPNPVKIDATCILATTSEMEMEITIYSISGSLLTRQYDHLFVGDNIIKVDVNNYPTGKYFFKVTRDLMVGR